MGSALPWEWFRETDEDECGLRRSSNAFMQGSFSWEPHPALAYEQTRVYVRSIRCRLLGPGCVKRREIERVLSAGSSRRDEKQQCRR